MLGVEQRTLSRLIGMAAIDAHARELNLALSNQTIADLIRSDPAFHDASGKFSSETFRSLLRQNGISEERYLSSRRRLTPRWSGALREIQWTGEELDHLVDERRLAAPEAV